MTLVGLTVLAVTFEIPTELVSATPYLATLIVLVLASKNFRMPKADGLVYRRGTHQ